MTAIEKTIAELFTNIGITYSDWVLLMIVLGCIIMFGIGMRIALMVSTFMLAGGYVMFSLVGMPTFNILVTLLLSIVLLSLSLLTGRTTPGVV